MYVEILNTLQQMYHPVYTRVQSRLISLNTDYLLYSRLCVALRVAVILIIISVIVVRPPSEKGEF